MGRGINENTVHLTGEIVEEPKRIERNGISYETKLMTRRYSGTEDIVPVLLQGYLIDSDQIYKGMCIRLHGAKFMSRDDENRKLVLYVVADAISFEKPDYNGYNVVELTGTIVKKPKYRKTPSGKEITELIIGNNLPDMRNNYFPCICWETMARKMAKAKVTTKIRLKGRIQSRTYTKFINEYTFEEHTTYEISVWKIEEIK